MAARERQLDPAGPLLHIATVKPHDAIEMTPERLRRHRWQQRRAIALTLAGPDHELPPREVHVLYAQARALE